MVTTGEQPAGEGAAAGTNGAALIVNTASRKGQRLMDDAVRLLEEAGVVLSERHELGDPGRLPEIVSQALERQPRMVIVGAGDGTISQVAGLLAYTGVPLAVLPFGTTNNAARSLGLPLALGEAVGVIGAGRVATIDLGRMGDSYFVNNANVGLNAEIAATVPHSLKKVLGRGAYWSVGFYNLLTHRAMRVTITEGDTVIRTRTHQLVIANGSHVGGAPVQEQETIADARLRILRLGSTQFDYVGEVLLATMRLRQSGEAEVTSVTDAIIETDKPRRVEVDGEPNGTTPVRVSVARGALKAIVPAAFRSER